MTRQNTAALPYLPGYSSHTFHVRNNHACMKNHIIDCGGSTDALVCLLCRQTRGGRWGSPWLSTTATHLSRTTRYVLRNRCPCIVVGAWLLTRGHLQAVKVKSRPATAAPALLTNAASRCPYAFDGDDSETGVHISRRQQWAPRNTTITQPPAWLAFDRQVRTPFCRSSF